MHTFQQQTFEKGETIFLLKNLSQDHFFIFFLNLEITDRLLGGFVYTHTDMHTQTNELTIQVRESPATERLANTLRPKTVQNSNRRGK